MTEPRYTRVAMYLQDKHPIREGMEYARYAEEKGFEAVWQAESRLVRDAIVPMAAFAAVTDRIDIGSGVINNWTRNIGLLAATFLTLDDLAPDRIICGIGAWWDPLAKNVGIDRRKPLTAMRETIEVMRRLLAMERVTYHGEFHNVDGIELDVVHGRREPRNVRVMIGATGPQMMELTGEIADGAVLNYCVPPEYNIEAMEQLERGAAKAGRSIDDIDRPQLVVCSVHDDRKAALDGARELLTQYLAQQPHIAKASGVKPEVVQQIQSILGWPATKEQVRAAMKYVPDELVQRITASGTPAEVKAKVREYIKYGATCPILYPLGDVKLMIDTFADGY
ncbi:MAG: LLM class flavin-dependent oxidoreductase [Caldilinea sp.]|nr:LLM class flavin-dependent oxidoreductase [Caldilineaceae bacterium]MCB9119173.1 LLM class flavin-dependent oxidoreductase [Caldilineaceae bacterium]MCB9126007.1 LLM class flavin-dependent oxidoreductase [Caldilineaceae bacterium]MCO5209612.1 LLM class flavin-dependent oxidoreductase [Caldilinea sp.]MCW5844476.1 LLM class flavin-dependent oxidoreductase [Caldilinea sp.]